MSDVQSIHEFDVNMICEYFLALSRQGPGSPEITNRALDFIEGVGPTEFRGSSGDTVPNSWQWRLLVVDSLYGTVGTSSGTGISSPCDAARQPAAAGVLWRR